MNKIILQSRDEELMQKVLWLVEHFKDDGLEISYKEDDIKLDSDLCLETLKIVKQRDFSKLKLIKNLKLHYEELGI